MRRVLTAVSLVVVLFAAVGAVAVTVDAGGTDPGTPDADVEPIPPEVIESGGVVIGEPRSGSDDGGGRFATERRQSGGRTSGLVDRSGSPDGGRAVEQRQRRNRTGGRLDRLDSDDDGLTDAAERENGTDPFAADSDSDGIDDARELAIGTDPTDPDTDNDGVVDARELDRGTSPLSADGDGDGLRGERELELGTDPLVADTDGDGLDDGAERLLGTDPTDADTDGDGLRDGWEFYDRTPEGAPLPGSDPLSKDLYVRVDYAGGAETRSAAFYDRIERSFAEMPVENPDDDTGIDVHVREGARLNASVTYTGDNFWTLRERYYSGRFGAGSGVYHQVVVAPFATDQVGYGEVGGEFSVVAARADEATQHHAVVHELLHNVVGDVRGHGACPGDPHHYCDGGWLTPHITPGEDEYLPDPLAEELERYGFVEE